MDAEIPGERRLAGMIRKIEAIEGHRLAEVDVRLADTDVGQSTGSALRALAARICAIHRHEPPRLNRKTAILCAADHGTGTGEEPEVGRWAGERAMAFLNGTAPVNRLARHVGVHVRMLDVGVAGDIPAHPNLVTRKIAWGTAPIAGGPAMGRSQAVEAVLAGYDTLAEIFQARAIDAVVVGEITGGDELPGSLVAAGLLGIDGATTCAEEGPLGGELARRAAAILGDSGTLPRDPLAVLTDLGGFEIGAMAGLFLAAARNRVAAVIDGFGSSVAGLLATELCPAIAPYLFVSHVSERPLHRMVVERFGQPELLGFPIESEEGVGGTMALGVLAAAASLWSDGEARG